MKRYWYFTVNFYGYVETTTGTVNVSEGFVISAKGFFPRFPAYEAGQLAKNNMRIVIKLAIVFKCRISKKEFEKFKPIKPAE